LRGGSTDDGLASQVAVQGNVVRAIKQARLDNPDAHSPEELAAAIDRLKALKILLHPPANKPAAVATGKGSGSAGGKADKKKGETLEGITTPKENNFGAWYSEVVVKSELIDYYDVSGCYILRPWAYAIWERVQQELDTRIKVRYCCCS